jgi:hypothetical protein
MGGGLMMLVAVVAVVDVAGFVLFICAAVEALGDLLEGCEGRSLAAVGHFS